MCPSARLAGAVPLARPEKVLFPDGTTKAQLAAYYERVAERMLPLVRGRPVHMQRFPNGIEHPAIHQKQAPEYFPEFVARVRVPRRRGGSVDHVMIDNPETLVYLAGQACVTPHVWLSRAPALECPDRLVFDLDPTRADLRRLRDAARVIRALFEEVGLTPYLMSTGSRGFHVLAPLDAAASFEESRALARALARRLAAEHPDRLTTEQRRSRRGDRLYLDVARNGYAQTAVAPYAVRARPGAPVACPLGWHELGRIRPDQITIRNLFRRLAQKRDPWLGIDASAAGSVADAKRRLGGL